MERLSMVLCPSHAGDRTAADALCQLLFVVDLIAFEHVGLSLDYVFDTPELDD
jgi:hypothetical protein